METEFRGRANKGAGLSDLKALWLPLASPERLQSIAHTRDSPKALLFSPICCTGGRETDLAGNRVSRKGPEPLPWREGKLWVGQTP
jgi:hypothetical protein